VTFNSLANSDLSVEERYFLISNRFSSSKICLPVKVVRAFFFLPFSETEREDEDNEGSNVKLTSLIS